MSDKSFKERVLAQSANFQEIYADFVYRLGEDPEGERWNDVFNIELPDGEIDDLAYEDKEAFNEPNRNEAVIKTLIELGVHEEWIGPLHTDRRIQEAYTVGRLSRRELVPPEFDESLARRHNVTCNDPIFWRTLLEILCRAFVASKGPRPWSLERTIELAFDMDEIRRSLRGGIWNEEEVLRTLSNREPYASKYPRTTHQAGVGQNRLREIVRDIGPMDDNALDRLKGLCPEPFAKVRHRRALLKRLSEDGAPSGPKTDSGL